MLLRALAEWWAEDAHAVDENGQVWKHVAVEYRRVAGGVGKVAAQDVTYRRATKRRQRERAGVLGVCECG